jgi:hypothetical protein
MKNEELRMKKSELVEIELGSRTLSNSFLHSQFFIRFCPDTRLIANDEV